MKKLVVLLLSVMAVFSACKKFEFEDHQEQVVPNKEEVKLFASNGLQKSNNVIRSNDTVYGNVSYYFSFWLTPAGVRGNFTITDSTGANIYNQSNNSIDWLAPHTGTYKLNVIGDTFGFTNITIIVHGGNITPPNPGPYAGPRLYDLIVADSTVSVKVVVTKEEYKNANSNYNWFWLNRINNLNFTTKLSPTTVTADSVYFTITFPRVSGTIIEFNAGLDDGTTGGTWLTPSAYSGPLPGSNGNPYSFSNSYFGFKFIIGGNYEIQSIGGTTILSISNNLPGSAGDGWSNKYRVRWTGLNYYIKTSTNSFRYKVGNGSWNYITMTTVSYNSNYMNFSFPIGISGQVYFQWGTGNSDATFNSWTSEMSESKFYISNLDCCAKNL
jgi:hypothetical protein